MTQRADWSWSSTSTWISGDAWEHADNPRVSAAAHRLAYRFAINYLLYSMTH